MEILFLGTGTSHGIPVSKCNCPVCTSQEFKNKRYRSSIMIKEKKSQIIIDTSPDFRLQTLRENILKFDGILLTHSHADHCHGLDDVRPYSYKKDIPLFCEKKTELDIKKKFSYIFHKTQAGGGKPRIDLNVISPGETFKTGNFDIIAIRVMHGDLPILGYRSGLFAYITDCSHIPEDSLSQLIGVKYLIIGALRDKPHPTHFNIQQAIDASRKIGAEYTWFTHICHDINHKLTQSYLPAGFRLAWDGLRIKLS